MAKKSKKLEELKDIFEEKNIRVEMLNTDVLSELAEKFKCLNDTRNDSYVKHLLSDVVMLTLLAVLSNADEWTQIEDFGKKKEEWLRKILQLPNGIPSHDTIQRVMAIIKNEQLSVICVSFLIEKLKQIDEIINKTEEKEIQAFDGKTSRGSSRKETTEEKIKALHTLSVYSVTYGISLAQVYIDEKSNEIPAMLDLLDVVDVKNKINTWDAMNTQKATVEKVIANGGEYVGALKGNQHNFYQDVVDFFTEEIREEIKVGKKNYKKVTAKENSNIVTREYFMTDDIEWLYNKEKWAGLKSIGMEQKTIEKATGEIIKEERYYIISFKNDIETFARAVREHWGIENGLHWHLDFTFNEDRNTTAEKNSLKNLGIIKKIVLGILKTVQYSYGKSLKRIRYDLSLNFEEEIEKIFKILNVEQLQTLLK